jgi:hypothetical protein
MLDEIVRVAPSDHDALEVLLADYSTAVQREISYAIENTHTPAARIEATGHRQTLERRLVKTCTSLGVGPLPRRSGVLDVDWVRTRIEPAHVALL